MSYIYIKNRKYHYYDIYPTWRKAYTVARYYKRRDHISYYILKRNHNNKTKYILYMTKIITLT